MSSCGNLGDEAGSSAGDGGLPVKFQRQGWESLKGSTGASRVIFRVKDLCSGQLRMKSQL